MAWYYFNDAREKIGPMTSRELKQLVQHGTITPETFVEDPNGRTGLAKDVKGLPFTDVSPSNGDAQKPEPNYFYFDASGYKYGPVSIQQLKDLAAQGAVNPNTPMETDTGHKGTAGQILNFLPLQPDSLPIPPSAASLKEQIGAATKKGMEWGKDVYQKAKPHILEAAQKVKHASPSAPQTNILQTEKSPILWLIKSALWLFTLAMLWLLDFAFRDIRIHVVNLWVCRIWYVLCCILLTMYGLVGTFYCFYIAIDIGNPLPILAVPLVWLAVLIVLILDRLIIEFCITLIDWMVLTTKAARLYIEEKSDEK